MAVESACSCEAIEKFLIDNGGKVTNQDLVKHFKKFLTGPSSTPNARSVFKDYVNTVATIKVEDDIKFVILKKRGHDEKYNANTGYRTDPHKNDSKKSKLSEEPQSYKNKDDSPLSQILHSHSSPSILGMAATQVQNIGENITSPASPPILWSSDLPPGHTPQPPPRRKYSMKGKENRGAKYEESLRQMYGGKESDASNRNDEFLEVLSPGTVKEKAHLLNKMASETDLTRRSSYHHHQGRRREHRDDKGDEDTCSISTLDPRRREWILKSAKSDYHELVRLLREEPKLAFVKDYNKYTALHWAAKHGNLDVIKLLAGTCKLDTNLRTSGGYTCLHIAAMFGREEIMEILINTYGADPHVRDCSGKWPLHYLPKGQVERFLTLFPWIKLPVILGSKIAARKPDKEPGLIRMGSLNSKVKKPSVFSASGRAITRMKSWGSADNLPDRDLHLMPPPKTFPKKKKSRKHADIIGMAETWRTKPLDSDSDSGRD